ncbi:MAG: PKD domain-containing protein [Bacteroidia bacterium]
MKKVNSYKSLKAGFKQVFIAAFLIHLFSFELMAGGPMLLRIDASGNSMQNETTVYFDYYGSLNYDSITDSRSLGVNPGYLNIVSVFNGVDCAIKGLPSLNQNMSIPLKVTTGTSGTYQIEGNEIQNLPSGACLILHDNLTNADFNLRSGAYTCSISDTESVARFVLNISITQISINTGAYDPTCSKSGDGIITASMPDSTGIWTYYWKDSVNNIVKITTTSANADTLKGLNAGWYRVDVSLRGTCLNGTSDYFLHGQFTPYALLWAPDTSVNIGTPVEFWNNSFTADSYWWDFGDGEGSNDTNTTHVYTSPGVFTAKLIAINSFCGDSAVQTVNITVINNETTGIKNNNNGENKDIIISRDEQGYYAGFSGNTDRNAIISVYDMLGKKVIADTEHVNIKNEKVHIALPEGSENQLFVISVLTDKGEKTFRKIIN